MGILVRLRRLQNRVRALNLLLSIVALAGIAGISRALRRATRKKQSVVDKVNENKDGASPGSEPVKLDSFPVEQFPPMERMPDADSLEWSICFERVSLAYRPGHCNVLNDMIFQVGHGEALGILGSSGSGKTTIFRALMRQISIKQGLSSGRILLGGVDLCEYNPRWLQQHIHYCHQFELTEADYYYLLNTTEETMQCAMQAVDLKTKFVTLQDAVAAYHESRNFTLRRKLSVASALLHKPKILLIDELDEISDKVIAFMRAERVTILAIQTNPRYLQFADRYMFVERGRICEEGTMAQMSTGEYGQIYSKPFTVHEASGINDEVEIKRSHYTPDVLCQGSQDKLLSPESSDHITELANQFSFKGYISAAEHRAITLEQLGQVIKYTAASCHKWHDTSPASYSPTSGLTLSMVFLSLYHLNTWVIKPATKEANCSFVELFTSAAQSPLWFVSHWWGEPIADFLKCIERHVTVRALAISTPFWVCAYANRQHALSEDLTTDPTQTSFYKALMLATGVLLILNDKTDVVEASIPFRRIWCMFEESTCLEVKETRASGMLLDIAAVHEATPWVLADGVTRLDEEDPAGALLAKAQRERCFPVEVIEAAFHASVQQAEASVQMDRVRILNCLAGRKNLEEIPVLTDHENYEKVNAKLRSLFAVAAWRQAVEHGYVERLQLQAHLAADQWCESVTLNFAFCEPFSNAAMQLLAKSLPARLKILNLDFLYCNRLEDEGLTSLAERLPSSLVVLKLGLDNCRAIGDEGVASLACRLPTSLIDLDLSFRFCCQITDLGLTSLAKGLPAKLERLALNFRACEEIGRAGLAALAHHIPESIQSFNAGFRGTGISSEGQDRINTTEDLRKWLPLTCP